MSDNVKSTYLWASAFENVFLLVAAAYFNNGWSVFFVALVLLSGFATGARLKQWFGPI